MSLVLPRHLTCQEIVELVTSYHEGALDDADRARFEEHLTACGACVTYSDQMRRTVDALGALDAPGQDPGAAIDPSVEQSLLRALRERTGAGDP